MATRLTGAPAAFAISTMLVMVRVDIALPFGCARNT
jgi:hypothetical protein